MLPRIAVSALILSGLAACNSTLDRAALRAEFAAGAPAFTSRSVEEIGALRPQLSLPCRVVVVPPLWRASPEWTSAERAELEAWGKELHERDLVSDFVLMPPTTLELEPAGKDPRSMERMRVAGARHRADVLLVIRDATARSEWANALALLDLTIVGSWIAPAHSAEAISLMDALLIDNRNEYLYLSGHGEGTARATRPWAYLGDVDLEAQARLGALAELKQDLFTTLRAELNAARAGRAP